MGEGSCGTVWSFALTPAPLPRGEGGVFLEGGGYRFWNGGRRSVGAVLSGDQRPCGGMAAPYLRDGGCGREREADQARTRVRVD